MKLPHRMMPEEKAVALSLYQQQWSCQQIAAHLGRDDEAIRFLLIREDVQRRPRRKYNLNQGYFDVIDTPAKARWLGFLAADGCVSTKGYYLTCRLAAQDRAHLEAFCQAVEYSGPLHGGVAVVKRATPYAHLQIQSRKICEALLAQGVAPRKSLTLLPWQGPPELLRYWWAGMFDGDGGFTHTTDRGKELFTSGFCGPEEVVQAYIRLVAQFSDTRSRGRRAGKIWSIMHGKSATQKIASYFYCDLQGSVPLARKAGLAAQLIAESCQQRLRWEGFGNEDLLRLKEELGTFAAVGRHLGMTTPDTSAYMLFRRRNLLQRS